MFYAIAGYAGSSIDGPLGGLRNLTNGNEDFLIFNVGNPARCATTSASRRPSWPSRRTSSSTSASTSPAVPAPSRRATWPRFDMGTMALMGHSMGATILPLHARLRAALPRRAPQRRGRELDRERHLQAAADRRSSASRSVLIGIAGTGYDLTDARPDAVHVPVGVPSAADPPVYAPPHHARARDGPARNVLMMQGIVDHYIMPPDRRRDEPLPRPRPRRRRARRHPAGDRRASTPIGPLLPSRRRPQPSPARGRERHERRRGRDHGRGHPAPRRRHRGRARGGLPDRPCPSTSTVASSWASLPECAGRCRLAGDPPAILPVSDLYRRYREALRGEPLPLAAVDLDALERNVDTARRARARARGKTLRVASKSVRCVALLRAIVARGGAAVRGVMAFSPGGGVLPRRRGLRATSSSPTPAPQPERRAPRRRGQRGAAPASRSSPTRPSTSRSAEVAAAAAGARGPDRGRRRRLVPAPRPLCTSACAAARCATRRRSPPSPGASIAAPHLALRRPPGVRGAHRGHPGRGPRRARDGRGEARW